MSRKIKVSTGAWQMNLEMTVIVVDEERFHRTMEEINNFFYGAGHRSRNHGSKQNAGLALFAAECFQLIAFHGFKDEEWLEQRFDWDIGDEGVEGFPSFADMGIKLEPLGTWWFDIDEIEIKVLA